MSDAGPVPPPAISDYGVIGDCRSAALVSRWGSIDWLCWPRFDSPSLFAAILDPDRGGSFAIRPAGPVAVDRRYLPRTNVLETVFSTPSGRLRLLDLMPVAPEEVKRGDLRPQHEILRVAECVSGEVQLEVLCDIRARYGAVRPRLNDRGPFGHLYEDGAEAVVLRSEVPLAAADTGLRGRERLRAGQRRHLSLSYSRGEPSVLLPFGAHAQARMDATVRWWEGWASRCRYEGPHRDAVVRSALVLKLMTYAPSGAVVAAPTTSLPERVGGVRNWDYRYCWLRDASLTLQALMDLGYTGEAEAFLSWMLHSTRLSRPELRVLYDVHGETRLPERELPHLAGHRASRPVRVGNDAAGQLQLDTYGDVVDAVYEYVQRGGSLDRPTARLLAGFGRTVCRRWREPDEGIWETRGGRRHHTYSKAMCWVALDRLVHLHRSGRLPGPADAFERERDLIRREIEARGFNPRLDSYVSVFDGDGLDASLLLLSRYGYAAPESPRMKATCARVHGRLLRNGLLYRYLDDADGLPPGEGAFGVASFWSVGCRAREWAFDEAERGFGLLCGKANDLGLFAEEIDPETGEALGNFPQAFTHLGLIDAALTLSALSGRGTRGSIEPGRTGVQRERG